MTVKALGANDESILANIAPDVFDDRIDPRAADEFLADPRHHLVVALEDGQVIGFASAVHYVHPDKPSPELWINEVAVSSAHRERGIAKAILKSLLTLASELGCSEAWVLTERDNNAAMRLYRSSGGLEAPKDAVMFTFPLTGSE